MCTESGAGRVHTDEDAGLCTGPPGAPMPRGLARGPRGESCATMGGAATPERREDEEKQRRPRRRVAGTPPGAHALAPSRAERPGG